MKLEDINEAEMKWAVYSNFDSPQNERTDPVTKKTSKGNVAPKGGLFTNKDNADSYMRALNADLHPSQRKINRMKYTVRQVK